MAPVKLKGLYFGIVYAFQGIHLVLQNPALRQKHHLRIFLQLSILSFILIGIAHILVGLPIHLIRFFFWMLSPSFLQQQHGINTTLSFFNNTIHSIISSLPFLLLLFMRYLTPQPLDNLFMVSLHYVDKKQNPHQHPSYAYRLSLMKKRSMFWQNMKDYLSRSWKKFRIGIILGALSMIPYVGIFVFPAAGAFATFKSLGRTQGIIVGVCFLCLPKWMTGFIIRGLLGMRVLMRELLEPYFSRMGMTHKQKRKWFEGRRDILFGFSAIAYLLIQLVPIFNFLAYGIIQAASAYMLVLVTDPPPLIESSKVEKSLSRKN
ncbi:hypothetical protein BJ944DRAFT_197551 [Cunninghamella echinulata]|nr:hypothetical protein BJ944DRAFT_197551 [Cunninghamella echinulata]